MQRLHLTTNRNSTTSAWLAALATLSTLFCLSAALFAQSQGSVTVRPADERPSSVLLLVDGKVVAAESMQMQRGQQVMVWIRDLEKLGWGKVEPLEDDRVSFKANGVTLTFMKKQDVALVNSLPVKLPINIYTRNGNMMVPLSFVAKALGYEYEVAERPVVSINTTPTPRKATNTIRGSVIYNGAPVIGVTIRAVTPDFSAVKDAIAQTDSQGEYRIEGLPDGTYLAYSYAGDNPTFINRSTTSVAVKGGETGQLAALELVQAITPVSPKPGTQVSPNKKGQIAFTWSRCEGAAKYRLIVRRPGSDNIVAESTVTKATAVIPASVLTKAIVYETQVNALSPSGAVLGSSAGGAGKPWTFAIRAK